MSRVDATRNIRHALRQLLPPRPALEDQRRIPRFLGLSLLTLAMVVMMTALLLALHIQREMLAVLPVLWLIGFFGGIPLVMGRRARDGRTLQQRIAKWEEDPRRQALERLGLDLAAGRLPEGLAAQELLNLEATAADWRLVREALETMSWAHGRIAEVRDQLRAQVDEAMRNLLAEYGTGFPLGPSPFLMERARTLFGEIAGEAATLSRLQARRFDLPTDHSLEDLRSSLDRLREARMAQQEMIDRTTVEKL